MVENLLPGYLPLAHFSTKIARSCGLSNGLTWCLTFVEIAEPLSLRRVVAASSARTQAGPGHAYSQFPPAAIPFRIAGIVCQRVLVPELFDYVDELRFERLSLRRVDV